MSEGDRISIYLSVFKHANLEVDWKAFAAEQGISTTGNAQRKFKEYLKKDSYQMMNGKIGPVGEIMDTPKKTPKKTKEKKTPVKKRKIERVEEDEDEEDASNEAGVVTEKVEEDLDSD